MKFCEGYRNLHENSFEGHKRDLRFALMKWKKYIFKFNVFLLYVFKKKMFYCKALVSCFWYVITIITLVYCYSNWDFYNLWTLQFALVLIGFVAHFMRYDIWMSYEKCKIS